MSANIFNDNFARKITRIKLKNRQFFFFFAKFQKTKLFSSSYVNKYLFCDGGSHILNYPLFIE